MNTSSSGLRILVIGNLVREVALVPQTASGPQASHVPRFARYAEWAGAPTLRRMIREAFLEDDPSGHGDAEAIEQRLIDNDPGGALPDQHCGELTTIMGSFAQESPARSDSDKVLRTRVSYFAPPAAGAGGATPDELAAYLKRIMAAADCAGIVVLYEMGPSFRAAFKTLGTDPAFQFRADPKRVLVISLDDDIDDGSVPDAIALLHGANSDAGRIVVVLTAEGLRNRGRNIVEHGSIEQTVRDVVAGTRQPPLEAIMSRADHVIILFEETGAVYLRRQEAPARLWQGSIHYCPNFDRPAQADREIYGGVPGRRELALTAIVKQIDLEQRPPNGPWELARGVRLGLAGYNLHFREGFKAKDDPFRVTERGLGLPRRTDLRTRLEQTDDKKRGGEFLLTSLEFPVNVHTVKQWNRLDNVISEPDPRDFATRLRGIVKEGPEVAFRQDVPPHVGGSPWFPGSAIVCPYLAVGAIKTADPTEIQGFSDLFKLMRKYLVDSGWGTPLSIAVFGPPGSGKSFAVKQVLKSIDPASKDALTFNLAQFDSLELLTEAFHQVQDHALSALGTNEVPLVIFDEFDARFDEPLGWLKYFLAPMQDGKFRGQSAEYRVGRAIFVFAGGTADTFTDFAEAKAYRPAAPANCGTEPDLSEAQLKAAKLPDFISRLKGHLNISNINPPPGAKETEHEERLRKVRRAMTLRSLLEQHAKLIMRGKTASIDDQVVNAFMNVRTYQHGVRSMETVIRMSRWIDGHFLPASMPSAEQVNMHAPGILDLLLIGCPSP